MPVIEFNTSGEVHQLKSAPPDGFIKARPLSYDEMLTRRDIAAKMIYRQRDTASKSSNGIGAKQDAPPTEEQVEMMMESANRATQIFQFSNQILDHNLEFPGGVKINFSHPQHLKKLPPKIGAEIETILDKLNEDVPEADFQEPSTTSSEADKDSALSKHD